MLAFIKHLDPGIPRRLALKQESNTINILAISSCMEKIYKLDKVIMCHGTMAVNNIGTIKSVTEASRMDNQVTSL